MKFAFALIVSSFLTASVFAAGTHIVSVKVDNEVYLCNGSTGGTDPACVKNVTDYCHSKTNYSSSTCFEKAGAACRTAPANFSACVVESTDYCYSKTNLSAATCFDKSLEACGGSATAIKNLMESAAARAK